MKSKLLYILPGLLLLLASCNDDSLSSGTSFPDEEEPTLNFDTWLMDNYVYPYNIQLQYRMKDGETQYAYNYLPPRLENSVRMAILIKHMWLEAYDEAAGVDFLRSNAPRIVTLVAGTSPFQGTAEGGMKIMLYNINNIQFTSSYLNLSYFKTLHHEFAHILDQKKDVRTSYELISEGQYVGASYTSVSLQNALNRGFISSYSLSNAGEDFAEMIAWFVSLPPEDWDSRVAGASASGQAIINEKLQIVKDYMREKWDIDLENLRDVVQRRTGEFDLLDLDPESILNPTK